MSELLRRRARTVVRIASMAWLLVLAPAELAATLARLASGTTVDLGLAAATLIVLRVLVTAVGLMLGQQLASGATGARKAAFTWAAADLGTLALVLASARLPSSRAPGDAPIVWGVYALAALIVIAAASSTPPSGD